MNIIIETINYISNCTNYIIQKLLTYNNIQYIYILIHNTIHNILLNDRVIIINISDYNYDHKQFVKNNPNTYIYLNFWNIISEEQLNKIKDIIENKKCSIMYTNSEKLFIDNTNLTSKSKKMNVICYTCYDNDIDYNDETYCYSLENCYMETSTLLLFINKYINENIIKNISFKKWYSEIKNYNIYYGSYNYFNSLPKLIKYENISNIEFLHDLPYEFNDSILSIINIKTHINPLVSVNITVYNKEKYLEASIQLILNQTYTNLIYEFKDSILSIINKKTNINPLVSVIITVYNKEKHLEASIKSILNQTYTNLEIIIVDDCSTDNSINIISLLNDTRVKKIYNKVNSGCYVSRNIAIKNSIGEYICFHDADDYSVSTRIEKQMNKFFNNSKLLLVGCNMMRTHLDNINYKDNEIYNEIKKTLCNIESESCCTSFFGLPTLIIKKEVFDKYGLYIEKRKCMDIEYIERIIYYEYDKLFKFDDYTWEYLNTFNNDIYYKVEELLYISPQMDNNNITNYEIEDEFITKKLWRDNYI